MSAKGTHWTPTAEWLAKNAEHLRRKCKGKALGRHFKLTSEQYARRIATLERIARTPALLAKRGAAISVGLKQSPRVAARALIQRGKLIPAFERARKDPSVQRRRIEKMRTPEVRKKISVTSKVSPLAGANTLRLHTDPNIQRKKSETKKTRPSAIEQTILMQRAHLAAVPMTAPETLYARQHPELRYVGNGALPIKTLVTTCFPDFINDETRELVEIWGDYWHRGQDPVDRIAEFAAVGWRCRVVWEYAVMG